MKKTSILLVEDDAWLADLYRDVLTAANFSVHHANSAEAALAILDKERPACIVLDIFLPQHNGIEFLHECASYGDSMHIPIIVLSSVPQKDIGMSMRSWQQYGVVEHLYKPTTKPDSLVQAVTRVIDEHVTKREQPL